MHCFVACSTYSYIDGGFESVQTGLHLGEPVHCAEHLHFVIVLAIDSCIVKREEVLSWSLELVHQLLVHVVLDVSLEHSALY